MNNTIPLFTGCLPAAGASSLQAISCYLHCLASASSWDSGETCLLTLPAARVFTSCCGKLLLQKKGRGCLPENTWNNEQINDRVIAIWLWPCSCLRRLKIKWFCSEHQSKINAGTIVQGCKWKVSFALEMPSFSCGVSLPACSSKSAVCYVIGTAFYWCFSKALTEDKDKVW